MQNVPEVKLGIIAVSRDCFPIGLSIARREAIVKAYNKELYEWKRARTSSMAVAMPTAACSTAHTTLV